MFIISFLSGKYCLTLVTIQKIQIFLMRVIKIIIGKMKGESGGRIIDEFVGLKPKMYSMLSDDGKESKLQKEWILQLSLMDLEKLYLIKK